MYSNYFLSAATKISSRYYITFQCIISLTDEDVEITYSYWDGSGHRKSCRVGVALVAFCVQGWIYVSSGSTHYLCLRLDSREIGWVNDFSNSIKVGYIMFCISQMLDE